MRLHSAFRFTVRAVFVPVVAVSLVVSVSAHELPAASAVPATAEFEASLAAAPSVLDAIATERSTIAIAGRDATAAVSLESADGVSTAKLTELREAVADAVAAADGVLPFEEDLAPYKYLGERPLRAEVASANISAMMLVGAERLSAVGTAVAAWSTELKAEQARILAAKKAAEAAARAAAAAAAAAAARGGGGSYSGGSLHDRVAQIAAGLPFSVPFVIGACNIPNAVACYTGGDSYVTIIPSRAAAATCKVRSALAHEYRHLWQYRNGKFIQKDGILVNRAALEADAYAFGYSYGC